MVTKTTKKKATKKKVSKKISKKIGRPTKYRPEYCDSLIEHLSLGLSYEIFGACLPDYNDDDVYVAKATVENWEKAHPAFLGAKKKGWALCQAFYEKKGVKHLTHSKNSVQLNTTAWIFNMKNRFNWTDKKEVTVEGGKEAVSLSLACKTDEDPDVVDARGGDYDGE